MSMIRPFRIATLLPLLTLPMALAVLWPATAMADPSTACTGLTAQESADKEYYEFTSHATVASGDTITDYKFDFGDKQSYDFNYPASSAADRTTANVHHTYADDGSYTATVTLLITSQGKPSKLTSPACTTKVTIGQPVTTLVNTGPIAVLQVFAVTTITGTLLYELHLHRRVVLG